MLVRYQEGKLTEQEQTILSAVQKDYSGEELTDEELELVSGGSAAGDFITANLLYIGAVVAFCGAGAVFALLFPW